MRKNVSINSNMKKIIHSLILKEKDIKISQEFLIFFAIIFFLQDLPCTYDCYPIVYQKRSNNEL